nr:MAG TPA: hypothetical protein [Caudoviricetes sp.]
MSIFDHFLNLIIYYIRFFFCEILAFRIRLINQNYH